MKDVDWEGIIIIIILLYIYIYIYIHLWCGGWRLFLSPFGSGIGLLRFCDPLLEIL